ncbi:nucleoside diphosphate kinase [Achlya hypogyna]|uniref:Nucleoside diphosphate kinase n=1 Tax=Achlya hypogyna TaxID=1202772 RepID=A0A1V9YL71_ACHHY|nr:nucleoside diphosphate kinase [Achlya hypogyna]
MSDETYAFVAEWFDPQAEIARQYLLQYFADGSLEMIDKKSLRPFLKRIKFPSINKVDLFVGACVTVYSRQIHLIDAANEYTRSLLKSRGGNRVVLVKPSGYRVLGQIISAIEMCNVAIVNVRMIHLQSVDMPQVLQLLEPDSNNNSSLHSKATVDEYTQDFSVPIEFSLGTPAAFDDVLSRLVAARLRAHVSVVSGTAAWLFDGERFGTTAAFTCCTLGLVRPRVVKEGKLGEVVGAILREGFEISALKLVHVQANAMNEFLAVYKDVTRQYHELVKYMSSGPIVALELRGDGDVVGRFQALCGPFDVQIARELAPASLRARFGKTNLHNGVHCTDCPEDGALEVAYFFRHLP